MGENGSGISLCNGLLYMKHEDSEEYEPIMAFSDVETIEPEEEKDNENALIAVDIPREYDFTIEVPFKPWALRRNKKIWLGFSNCRGPGRYKSIARCLEYMRKAYAVDSRYLSMLARMGKLDARKTMAVPIDVTGLPCTDILEYLWLLFDEENYYSYREGKINRTKRSQSRRKA